MTAIQESDVAYRGDPSFDLASYIREVFDMYHDAAVRKPHYTERHGGTGKEWLDVLLRRQPVAPIRKSAGRGCRRHENTSPAAQSCGGVLIL